MLDEALRSDVPYFDWFVWTTCGYASTIWVESNSVHALGMVIEDANHVLWGHVPKLYWFVFWSRSNKSCVRTELSSLDPIWMGVYAKHKFAILELENFEQFVIWTGKQESTVLGERNCFYWRWVAFNDLRVAFNCVVPNTYCFVRRTWHNSITRRRNRNWVDKLIWET